MNCVNKTFIKLMLGLIAFILAIVFYPEITFPIVLVILIIFAVIAAIAAIYTLALAICDK